MYFVHGQSFDFCLLFISLVGIVPCFGLRFLTCQVYKTIYKL